LFVSPRFLFPADSGGRIRTTQVLRGLKGGAFVITLVCPAAPGDAAAHAESIANACDRFLSWPEVRNGKLRSIRRLMRFASPLPLPVADDRSDAGRRLVAAEVAKPYDVVVFDFPHTAVLAPPLLPQASVLFTHNVESEIFRRHAEVAPNGPMRWIWRDQLRKMLAFEGRVLRQFDLVVAVSERDKQAFVSDFGVTAVKTIPTGVDVDYFGYAEPAAEPLVVFTGAMDWTANIDGIAFLMDEVWPHVCSRVGDARMIVVGRNPPPALVARARRRSLAWTFTGFVEDVRPHVHGAAAYVIPLRVGGGTRMKVFEAMSMGCPVVSTGIGTEGLPVEPDRHYLRADDAQAFADAIVRLLQDRELGRALSRRARDYVAANFSFRIAARAFEGHCLEALAARRTPRAAPETRRVSRPGS
jgi:glycosyltransferase involved in cell wall biosynthesis